MLDKLLLWARNMEASDLHIRPASVPMVRVDAVCSLCKTNLFPGKLEKALLALLPEQENSSCCRQVRLILLLVTVYRSAAGSMFIVLAAAMRRRFVCFRRKFLTATVLACRKLFVSLLRAAAVCCSLQVPQEAAKAPRLPRWYSR